MSDASDRPEDIKKQLTSLLMQLPVGNTTANDHVNGGSLKPQQPATPSTPRKGAGLLGKGKLFAKYGVWPGM